MNWIKKILHIGEKIKKNINKKFPTKSEQESSLWISLDCCAKGPILKTEIEKNLFVCPNCNGHKRISGRQRLDFFFGKDQYKILEYPLPTDDPLSFPGYKEKLVAARKKTEQSSAILIATGKINNINVTVCASNFSYIGGSTGAAEGEGYLYAIQHAITNQQPFINFTCGGGIRLFESMIGLSQMTRTTVAISELKKNNLPYIVVLTDPTSGGQLASFAMLGDFHYAEPAAIVAFAGSRVIKATVNEELPIGFQRSEYVQKTGFIDVVTERKNLPKEIGSLLSILLKQNAVSESVSNNNENVDNDTSVAKTA